jgi:hypothetical protein
MKYAQGLMVAKNYPAAIQVLATYLKGNPNDVEAYNMLGRALAARGDWQRAEAAYRRMVTLAPGDDRASYNLALVLIRMERLDEARQWLQAALQANPSLDRARQLLQELDAQANQPQALSGGPALTKPAPATTPLDSGNLLRSGTRRLGSFANRFAVAALLILVALPLHFRQCPCDGSLSWLAEWFTFPRPSAIREQLEVIDGMPGAELLEQQLQQALERQAAISARLDQLIVVVAYALPLLGVAIAVHALLAAGRTAYHVYERRVDLAQGVFNRRRQSVWLYEIKDVELRQPFLMNMTGNAAIRIGLDDNSHVSIVGFGPLKEQVGLYEELRDSALKERRAMKNWWV